MYGCGIGPIVYARDKKMAAHVINTCVDKITLREPDSRETLREFGVTVPEVILASDPALTLPAAEHSRIDSILRAHDMDIGGKYIGFVLRKWPGMEEKATVFAAGAVYAYLKYGLTPVFLGINFRADGEAGQLVTEHLSIPFYRIDEQMTSGEVIGVLSRMTAVVSMRLHGLIFAAGQGVPLIGVAYDPKVTAFLDYVEQNNYIQLAALNEKDLSDMIDSAVALAEHRRARAVAEDAARAAVCPVDDTAHALCADDKHAVIRAAGKEARRRFQRKEEAAAGRRKVKRRAVRADAVLHHASRARRKRVACDGRRNDEVELIGSDTRIFQRALGRFHRHIHIRFRLADVAGAHADALCDPFIVGVYKRREVVVRHNMLRRVAACT